MIAEATETRKQIIQERAKDKYTRQLMEKAETGNKLEYNGKILQFKKLIYIPHKCQEMIIKE